MKSISGASVLLFLLLGSVGSLVQAEETDRVLARWRGGELRESVFQSRYAPGKKQLHGDSLNAAICKASFQEIYVNLAQEQGLDRTPAYRSEMESWRRDFLARSWRNMKATEIAKTLGATELMAEWQKESAPGGEFFSSPRVDVDILFLPCGLRPGPRQACRAQAAELDRRLAAGEAFDKLALEQREHGGPANGPFQDVPLANLNADLSQLIEATPKNRISPWLEAPHGLFRIQLLDRREGNKFEMSAFEPQLREMLVATKIAQLVQTERSQLGLAAGVADVDVMAKAARRLGLENEDEFVRRENEHSRWWLADQAFLADRANMPSDEVLAAKLMERRNEFEEIELEVLLLDPKKDRQALLEQAGKIEELLATAKDKSTRELFRDLASRFPELRRELLGPIRAQKLGSIVREFEKLPASLKEGDWRGPIPLAETNLASAIDSGVAKQTIRGHYETLAFVRLASRSMPTLEAARSRLYLAEREKLGTGTVYFLSVFKPRWDFELLPSESNANADAKP